MATMQLRLALQLLSNDRVESPDRNIAEAAYYRAEQRGFVPGYELDDWLAAEREILALYDESANPSAQSPQSELKSVGYSVSPAYFKQPSLTSTG
jgi:hypothetical protein